MDNKAIVLKETGEFIGWCCSGIKDELPPPNREIMYAVSKDHRGKGYTTQASQGMIAYLFEHAGIETLKGIFPQKKAIQTRWMPLQADGDIRESSSLATAAA